MTLYWSSGFNKTCAHVYSMIVKSMARIYMLTYSKMITLMLTSASDSLSA